MMKKPLCIDLFAGLGGWSDGFIAEGWDCIGFDIERHDYEAGCYPGQLVLQDCLTLMGSQFKSADCIVASPPCQFFSYCAMPWTRAKQLAAEVRSDPVRLEQELALFNACFRIRREAIEAAGHHIPLIVENVRGAIPWVGRSRWDFGSYHLWGDVPALMPMPRKEFKVPGFRFDGNGGSFQTAAVEGMKNDGGSWFGVDPRGNRIEPNNARDAGVKHSDQDGYERKHENAFGWKAPRKSSNSKARKAASAAIAKIPFPLSSYIARHFKP